MTDLSQEQLGTIHAFARLAANTPDQFERMRKHLIDCLYFIAELQQLLKDQELEENHRPVRIAENQSPIRHEQTNQLG